ncbi:MAG: Asp-tRNA(Asn)/Glu-tRNA(Gln) amidotransferase subunit GatC [Candidatus Marinimicrobia bacterium]|nr:Asp-tRNA(Asn)/Glu-tRNA(Gln) amidotransferase subunit GatC [Candidatus Neomarinimicrobiota bacterium]
MSTKPTVTPEEIKKIAGLAKLTLTDEQCRHYTGQINTILEHMRTLDSVNTEGIQQLAHVLEITNVYRPDKHAASMPHSQAIDNAPTHVADSGAGSPTTDGDFFLVPGVFRPDA